MSGVSKRTPLERFLALIDQSGDCWQWLGTSNGNGYGRFLCAGRLVYPHRWAHEEWIGPIPTGFDVDHLCRNRGCVNPAHLEAVTHRENVLRGTGPGARAFQEGACARGHAYTPENTRAYRGGRECRTCARDRQRRRRARTLVIEAETVVHDAWLERLVTRPNPFDEGGAS